MNNAITIDNATPAMSAITPQSSALEDVGALETLRTTIGRPATPGRTSPTTAPPAANAYTDALDAVTRKYGDHLGFYSAIQQARAIAAGMDASQRLVGDTNDPLKADLTAARSQGASASDDWMRQAAGGGEAGPAAPVVSQGTQPQVTAPPPDLTMPYGIRAERAPQAAEQGFGARLQEAVASGAAQSIKDLVSSGEAVMGKAGAEAPPAIEAAQPITWADFKDPGTVVLKAVYNIAHGAPVLAGGIAGGVAGGALGTAVAPGAGTAAGAIGGGALGAGAVTVAQTLGPYFAAATKENPGNPDAAFNEALKRAGIDGAFSAAGWAAFGFAPFAGAVKNILFQALAVQPGVAVANRAAQNVEAGRPAGEGVGDVIPGAVVNTAGPLAAFHLVRTITGALGRPPEMAAQGVAESAGAQAGTPTEGQAGEATAPQAAAPAGGEAAKTPAAQYGADRGVTIPGATKEPVPGMEAIQALPNILPELNRPAEGRTRLAGTGETLGQPPAGEIAPPGKPRTVFDMRNAEAAGPVITDELRAKAADWFTGKTRMADVPVQASLEAMADTQVMQRGIVDIAKQLEPGTVKPDDVTRAAAYSLNVTEQDIASGNVLRGRLPSDEQVAAFTMLLDAGGKKLWEAATRAAETNDPADYEAAVRAYALQNKIVGDWTQSGTEQGLAFRARGQAWGQRSDFARSIDDIVSAVGPENMDEAIRRIATIQEPHNVSGFVGTMRWLSSRDGMLFAWYNWLLGPATFSKKVATDLAMPIWNSAVRYSAEKFSADTSYDPVKGEWTVAENRGGVAPGETGALIAGYIGSFKDALRAGAKAMATGESAYGPDYQTIDAQMRSRLSLLSNGADNPIPAGSPTRGAMEVFRAALPTTWLMAADDWAMTWNERAEARALAYREGYRAGLEGEALNDHVEHAMVNMQPGTMKQAREAAQASIFNEPLSPLGQSIMDGVDRFNWRVPGTALELPVGKFFLPFVKRPANFVRFTYRNSPLPAVFPSEGYQADIAAGGARADIARARVGLGTGVAIAVGSLALGGQITGKGPTEPTLRKGWIDAGNVPYSFKPWWSDRWYEYNSIEPFGMMIGATADAVNTFKMAQDEDWEHVAAGLTFGLGNSLLSKTYMQQMANFFEALNNPDNKGKDYIDGVLASFVPPVGARLAHWIDPWLRAHYSALDIIETRFPWLSKNLPPAVTVWGDPIPVRDYYLPGLTGTLAASLFSPIRTADASNVLPIDKWIWDNRRMFKPDESEGNLPVRKMSQTQSWPDQAGGVSASIQLTPEQHHDLQVLAGNGLKDPSRGNLGAKDYLNALVQGQARTYEQKLFDKSSPEFQAMMVRRIIGDYRRAAKIQLLRDHPELVPLIREQQASRRKALRSGANAPGGTPGAPAGAPGTSAGDDWMRRAAAAPVVQ